MALAVSSYCSLDLADSVVQLWSSSVRVLTTRIATIANPTTALDSPPSLCILQFAEKKYEFMFFECFPEW